MRTCAVIMAGGAGTRMRAGGGPTSKPLAPVRGVPLVERNLLALLGAGFDDVKVAVPRGHAGLAAWLDVRGELLAQALGARLERIEEPRPLGSMGAVALLGKDYGTVLVVFADNLTSLDLRALTRWHGQAGAALTIATHAEAFRLPYGVPQVDGDRVIAFDEKPTLSLLVSSGLYVLGAQALTVLTAGEAIGAPALLARLLASGLPVVRYQHTAAWIDVNDLQALARAEQLAASEPALECWSPRVHAERASVLLGHEGRFLVRRAGELWELPGVIFAPGDDPGRALVAAGLVEPHAALPLCACFDDVDLQTGRVVRHHVLLAHSGALTPAGMRWPNADEDTLPLAWSTCRALACAATSGAPQLEEAMR